MPSIRLCLLGTLAISFTAGADLAVPPASAGPGEPAYVLVIHGGAGTLRREELNGELEAEIRGALEHALDAGGAVLARGGSSLDAVTAAVTLLEDAPYFNAGRGAVFTADGRNELDAAIMDGSGLRAGAVAGVTRIRNPLQLAREVMENSPHVMLVGEGAEQFARSRGIDWVDPEYFHTELRWQQLEAARAREKEHAALPVDPYFGTVGAVALDQSGRLAAATSTGGMTNKRWGRVGDAPLIGAGTYADSRCAVSATGWGEFFIRLAVAHDICARVAYAGTALPEAATEVIMQRVPELGGDGGVIAVGRDGEIAMPHNTAGMYRGWLRADGSRGVAIFSDEADGDGGSPTTAGSGPSADRPVGEAPASDR